MKTLYIVRHAKSSWRDAELADVDRPLKARGVLDAQNMAQHLLEQGANPDYILSSPAIRALHTAIIFARVLELPYHRVIIRNRLYASSADVYREVLQELESDVSTVMLFGHDPTATNFVNQYTPQKLEKFPTAGVIGFTFEATDWQELKKAKLNCTLQAFPKKSKK